MFIRKYRLIAALVLGISLTTACVSTSQGTTQREANDQISKPLNGQNFRQIFRDAEKVGEKKNESSYDVSRAAEEHIKSCCADEESVLRLLTGNGFKVHPRREDTDKPDIDHAYDERIVAERTAERTLYMWKLYRVAVYLDKNKIVGVRAYVFQDGL
ncbi:hypothetical protein [Sinorhizobium fredii]|uniref:hypothetical protein n=1 Tax=Rhizobium fredii TaxID=380 RepID=UPI000595603F|nr:hypothetical protein [Sinorhizobium fredii]WOS62027.1 hypothetical protein SFGR64A_13880 [Sinorhizobium fredii GR64]